MPRKKAKNQEGLLTHVIALRVDNRLYKRLEKMSDESRNLSVAQVIRNILNNRQIKIFREDDSMNRPMEEMALIRKELKAIGININQITRTFNQDKAETHRAFYVMKVANLYKNVDAKVDRLLIIISKLAEKWLQK